MKYIGPSYMVRAVAANAADNLCCTLLAHSAIDGAMAGYTGFVPGLINGNYGYIPDSPWWRSPRRATPSTQVAKWAWVRSVTNQPDFVQGTQMPLRIARKCPGRAHTSVLCDFQNLSATP